jgi:hypothetical protein
MNCLPDWSDKMLSLSEFETCSHEFNTKLTSSCDYWRKSETTDQYIMEKQNHISFPAYTNLYYGNYGNFESSSAWGISQRALIESSSVWDFLYYRAPKSPRANILGFDYLKLSILIESETNNFPKPSQITSATEKTRNILPKPFPVISGAGAEKFREELETMEYPEHIKSFYKDSKELVKKLGLFP